jgi:hypothetical protein
MKNLFFVISLTSATFLTSAQTGVTVRFLYNGKNLDIEKELVNFSSRDTIQIVLESREPINVEEIRVQPFFARFAGANSGQQQVQTQQKVKLVQGTYKRFQGFSNQKRIIIKIPVKSFPGNNLSKLKLNVVNCTNKKGDKLIRSNKAFEIFSPLASRI